MKYDSANMLGKKGGEGREGERKASYFTTSSAVTCIFGQVMVLLLLLYGLLFYFSVSAYKKGCPCLNKNIKTDDLVALASAGTTVAELMPFLTGLVPILGASGTELIAAELNCVLTPRCFKNRHDRDGRLLARPDGVAASSSQCLKICAKRNRSGNIDCPEYCSQLAGKKNSDNNETETDVLPKAVYDGVCLTRALESLVAEIKEKTGMEGSYGSYFSRGIDCLGFIHSSSSIIKNIINVDLKLKEGERKYAALDGVFV